ncbi:MAG: hypothetical protein AB1Z23_09095 [Eubacteriales bacterium]
MKKVYIIVFLIVSLFISGCEELFPSPTVPPDATIPVTDTPSPYNTLVGTTPNVTASATDAATATVLVVTPSPTEEATATPTPKPTIDQDVSSNKQLIDEYMPPLNTVLRFSGIAETGHFGQLVSGYTNPTDAMYQFNGTYDDGMGVPDKFVIKYFIDYARGTVTEKAISNERLNKAEFHSKLHNIVVLKFPLSLGATWGHSTYIDSKKYWVTAKIIEYSGNTVKVQYTASDVAGYYNNTYIEIRTFEKGYGMTSFANIMPGELDLTGIDTADDDAVMEYIMNMYMFGYGLNK